MQVWKWICLSLLPVTMVSVATAAPARAGDNIEVRRLGIPAVDAGSEAVEQASNDYFDWAALDEVWTQVGEQDWTSANQKLSRLKERTPNWMPPAEMVRLIEQGLQEQAFAEAIEEERWADALRLMTENEVFCPDAPQFWGVSRAYAEIDRGDDLVLFLQSALDDCKFSPDQLLIVDRAAELLSLEQLSVLRDHASATLAQAELMRLEGHFERMLREHAILNQDWVNLAALGRVHGVREATLQAAWGLLDSNPSAAQAEFEYALLVSFDLEAEYGAALAIYQAGDHGPALKLVHDGDDDTYRPERAELSAFASLREADLLLAAGDYDRAERFIQQASRLSPKASTNATNLLASVSLARADEAYHNENYSAAIEYARAAEQIAITQEAAQIRIAWSLYQSGDDKAAYEAFSALYQATTSPESADGLVLAASRMGWLDRLQPMAVMRSGPLLNRLKSETARVALGRKDYLIAQQASPTPLAELVGLDRLYVRQSVSVRSNDGASGEGRVTAYAVRTSIGFATGQTHVELGAVAHQIDAGIGVDPARSSEEQSVTPFIQIEREGQLAVSAQISTTPVSGPVASQVIGEVAIAYDSKNEMRTEAAIFKRAVDESLTSAFGRESFVTGETWGRVVETGLEASVAKPVNDTISVQASAAASTLDGKSIEKNQSVKMTLGAVKSFDVEGYDYLSAGPFYQFQSFAKNTNFHSPEHGGYFSPQSYHRVGFGVYGQTEDLKTWMLRYEVSGAVEVIDTDATPIRPRTAPEGGRFEGSSETNLAGAGRIEFARKLNEEWTFTAGASAIASSAFNEVQAGIALKFVPGGKARVSSRDMAPDLFARDIL